MYLKQIHTYREIFETKRRFSNNFSYIFTLYKPSTNLLESSLLEDLKHN